MKELVSFIAILELAPKARIEEELEKTLTLAAGLRRLEFLLALLIACGEPDDDLLKKCNTALCQACRPRVDLAIECPVFPRHYSGLKKETRDSLKKPRDIHYQNTIIQMLVRYGTALEVDQSNTPLNNPLIWAISPGNASLAKTLLYKHQANPLFRTNERVTPLSVAVYHNNLESVRLLSGLPSNIWKRMLRTCNFLGEFPLHYAAMKGNANILKVLLQWEQPIRRRQFMNCNVLHLAASVANKRGFEILFNHIRHYSTTQLTDMLQEKNAVGGKTLIPLNIH